MKASLLLTALTGFLLVSPPGYGQTVPDPPPPEPGIETPDSMRIFEKVEVEASFPGGDKAFAKYLEENLNAATPVLNGAPAGTYHVLIQFLIDRNGTVSRVTALTKYGYGMEAEVIRIIRKSPAWVPALQNGRAVRAYHRQPVTFVVEEEKRKRKKYRNN